MNLLFVHDHQFHSYKGQIYSDKLPFNIFERYLQKFDRVTVWGREIKLDKPPDNLPLSSGENIKFYFGKNISSLSSFVNVRSNEKERLHDIIKKSDAVISRLPSEYGLMAVKLANSENKPFGVEVVGCAWDALWNYGSLKGKIYAPILYKRMKTAVARSDYTVYVSNQFLQARYPPKKNAEFSNISNVELETTSDSILEDRLSKIDAIDSKVVFGTIGSLKTRYKGIHIAIKALSKLNQLNIDFEYRVLGSGNKEEYVVLAKKLGIEENIYFDGTLPSGEQVFKWIDQLDIYLQPSLTEGLPRAVIEAMSRGCPVIASIIGGIPELIDVKWLHKPGDYKKLSNDLVRLVNDKDLMKRLATENFLESKNYSKSILDKRRSEFLDNFVQFVKSQN